MVPKNKQGTHDAADHRQHTRWLAIACSHFSRSPCPPRTGAPPVPATGRKHPCVTETSPTKKKNKSSRHSKSDSLQIGTSTSAGDKQSSAPNPTSPSPSARLDYAPSSEAGAIVTTATKYSDRTYRKRAAELRKVTSDNGWPCHLCGKPIDMSLPYTHPLAFTADHLDAIANGGNLLGDLAPAHRRCNSRRGRKRLAHQVRAPKTTQAW